MKIINIGISVLLASSLFANNTLTDTTNKLKNDIKKDGTNINFVFNLTDISIDNGLGYDNTHLAGGGTSATFATVGIMLLPNTWKINISYSGQVRDESLIFGDNDMIDAEKRMAANGDTYLFDDGKTDLQWIDFYMKPISTKYGNFGFGYKYNKSTTFVFIENYNILDKSNAGNTASYTVNTGRQEAIRNNGTFAQYYTTYNIPTTNSWYNGFGLQYGYETSDNAIVIKNKNGIVLKPDTTSHILAIGWNKTLDEIKTGLSFKNFQYGTIASKHKYYNFETAQNESLDEDGSFLDLEVIYMFKPRKDKKFYISVGRMENDIESGDRDEFTFELGMIF